VGRRCAADGGPRGIRAAAGWEKSRGMERDVELAPQRTAMASSGQRKGGFVRVARGRAEKVGGGEGGAQRVDHHKCTVNNFFFC
jgi:hypothetical protein